MIYRNNLSQYSTQKATAFLSPSAAVYFDIALCIITSHIGSLYGIHTILSGEVEGIAVEFKERNSPSQDITSLSKERIAVYSSIYFSYSLAHSTGLSSISRYSKVP